MPLVSQRLKGNAAQSVLLGEEYFLWACTPPFGWLSIPKSDPPQKNVTRDMLQGISSNKHNKSIFNFKNWFLGHSLRASSVVKYVTCRLVSNSGHSWWNTELQLSSMNLYMAWEQVYVPGREECGGSNSGVLQGVGPWGEYHPTKVRYLSKNIWGTLSVWI